ncbi:MAG: hypothetical protein Q9179_007215 [Wetmoreana sp. 5 TL-2023]
MEDVFQSIRNRISDKCMVVRGTNAITICSTYPMRHIQIILRLFKSKTEILTHFDVDCCCFGYDGSRVYGTPRGITALLTQANTVDLTRRSPSYEHRLIKYAQRGFEIYWRKLNRHRIDNSIFDQVPFAKVPFVQGLARLLVYEEVRERPSRAEMQRLVDKAPDRLDLIAEPSLGALSDYNYFEIPYGPEVNVKSIVDELSDMDARLNSEQLVFSYSASRVSLLHRHPFFFADSVSAVIEDCCWDCPEPVSEADKELLEKEKRIYVRGKAKFIKDHPGRQAIGSFNPTSADDWTYDAYNDINTDFDNALSAGTAELKEYIEQNQTSIYTQRDLTGRTLLQRVVQYKILKGLDCLLHVTGQISITDAELDALIESALINGSQKILKRLLRRWPTGKKHRRAIKTWLEPNFAADLMATALAACEILPRDGQVQLPEVEQLELNTKDSESMDFDRIKSAMATGSVANVNALIEKIYPKISGDPPLYKGITTYHHPPYMHARTNSEYWINRPLLWAAYYGNYGTLDYFFTKALELYDNDLNYENEYGRFLTENYCPYDRWIKHGAYLALHSAILSTHKDSPDIIDLILKHKSDWKDFPSKTHGLTPLAVAFVSGNSDAAQKLIKAGANPRTRDWYRRNVVHLALEHFSKLKDPDLDQLSRMLKTIPERLRIDMFSQTSRSATATKSDSDARRSERDVLRTIIDLGAHDSLSQLNHKGQSPLHQVVQASLPLLAQELIEEDPNLLFMEDTAGEHLTSLP